ncbi:MULTISPECIES: hypothetical protein [unclassified Streptomyces]|jgi:hypothetical protein|uniref:hypothetical protein n=1 Tax=unclassified Streptomyces TaxID=2593676 RepID=UPI00114EF26B|nr:hypothetical protein [Streptomyces sp. SLBN-31]TQJ85974.1 hypothetical protein FBY22_4773 [Streptomyces sp. SLBN-31]
MNIRQIPVVTTEAVLYLLAAILAFLCLGLAASVAGLPLVPLVIPAIVGLVLLARHLAHHHPLTKV